MAAYATLLGALFLVASTAFAVGIAWIGIADERHSPKALRSNDGQERAD